MNPRETLVGREPEFSALLADLAAACAGGGRLVLLVGEPGIGKTCTATALAAAARGRGASVVWGRCQEHEGAPVYWPWAQALAAASEAHPQAREFATLLPLLRAVDATGGAEAEPARARFELFDRVVAALAAEARAQPLVIVLDDLHWADAGSLLLLEFVARELDGLPLLILATTRSEESRDATRVRWVARLARVARTQVLAGLERPAVRALLAHHVERELDDADFEQIYATTEGNPFFVIEMAQLFVSRAPRDALPPGGAELMRRRLDALPAASLRALDVAAVLGRDFELGPLTGALREEPLAVLAALEPALAHGLIRLVPGALRRFSFAHALLRETLYRSLAPGNRVALHRAVAESLEAEATGDESAHLTALAHHYFEAAQLVDPGKAIHYAREAGTRALRLFAFDEAARHFERALAASALAQSDEARLPSLLGLGEALHGLGDRARMDAAFREALGLARCEGGEVFASAVLRFARLRAELGALDFELNALLEEALDLLPESAPGLRARLLAQLAAGLHLLVGEEKRAQELSDEAACLARRLADPATLTYVLRRRLITLLGPDQLELRSATADEILALPSQSEAARLDALSARVDSCAERGDRAGLDRALASFEQAVSASRQPFLLWTAATFRTGMALFEGRLDDAEVHAAKGLELGRRAQARSSRLRFLAQQFTLRALQGRVREVGPMLEAGASEVAVVPVWRALYGNYLALAGRHDDARRELDAFAADGFASIPRATAWLTTHNLLAATCWHLLDSPRAAHLYTLLEPYAGRIVVSSPLVAVVGPVDESLGLLATLLGRTTDAECHFADALGQAERMRAVPWQAQIRCEWAGALQRRAAPSDRERALALLDGAETLARSIGIALRLGWIERPSALPEPTLTRVGAVRFEGDLWTIEFEGRTTRLKDMVGIRYLAQLLERPELEIHCAELAGIEQTLCGDAGELLDSDARSAYQERLRDVGEELAEAERRSDRGWIERLSEERDALEAELVRGFDLRGRPRRAGSANERARLAVSRALRYAIERIAERDASLAEHLRRSVRTGAFCAYAPSPRDLVVWTV
jgi:hypothetical protein